MAASVQRIIAILTMTQPRDGSFCNRNRDRGLIPAISGWFRICSSDGVLARSSPLVREVIGAAIDVHRAIGPGLLESAYEHCFTYELAERGIEFRRQVAVPVVYKGVRLDCGYRVDLLIGGEILVEIKSVEHTLPIHEAQILTYLKLLKLRQGLLINFNVRRLTDGLRNFLL
jgi:GxxExxY protein